MAEAMVISGEGVFEVEGSMYRIPERFSVREAHNYRSLMTPVPEIAGERTLTAEQRAATERFLLRRAAACLIPGFSMSVSESLSPSELESINRWIIGHRWRALRDAERGA